MLSVHTCEIGTMPYLLEVVEKINITPHGVYSQSLVLSFWTSKVTVMRGQCHVLVFRGGFPVAENKKRGITMKAII